MPPATARPRNMCFTLNNPTEIEQEALNNGLNALAEAGGFAGFGRETGEEGTPHLQGFICSKNPKTYAGWHSFPGLARAHFEIMAGTIDQSITYCSKDGDYSQFGTQPAGQGRRTDLESVALMVREGKSIREISAENPVEFIKFAKGIERLHFMQQQPRTSKTEVLWFWGATGTGKSKTAFEMALASNSWYSKDPTTKWWDGYEQQDTVVVDDYRRDFCTFAQLLRLMDRYPLAVEVKGGYTQFRTQRLIITSPFGPRETWEQGERPRSDGELQQLIRRIDRVEHFANLEDRHIF